MSADRFEDADIVLWKVTQLLSPDGPVHLSAPQWYCPNCIVWLSSPKQAREHVHADAEEARQS